MKRDSATERAATRLARSILAGKYGRAGVLPPERDLCGQLGLSRMTVREVLARLEQRGLIDRQQGKRTTIRTPELTAMKPIALLLREPHKTSSHYITELIRGASSYLDGVGSSLSITSTPPSRWTAAYAESLGGVLIIPTLVEREDVAALGSAGLPYVVVAESDLPGPAVRMRVDRAAESLVRGLLARGHRRFAMISGHGEHSDRFKRNGIARALASAGLTIENVPDFATNYDVLRAEEVVDELMRLRPRPTAVLGFDDDLATHALAAAQRAGIDVPDEMSIVGFNDAPFADLLAPPLTTARLPVFEAGQAAARSVSRAFLTGAIPRSVTLKHDIIWRDSVARAP